MKMINLPNNMKIKHFEDKSFSEIFID